MNEKIIEYKGVLKEFKQIELGGKSAFSVKVDNIFLTWWNLKDAIDFSQENPIEKEVFVTYTEKPNPKKPQYPYRNINSMGFPENYEVKTEREIAKETVAPPLTKDVPNGFKPAERSDGTHWKSKSIFLEKKTGIEIVDKQNEINNEDGKFIVATQIFTRDTLMHSEKSDVAIQLTDDKGHVLYDCFIYYKESPFIDIKK